MGPRGGSAFRHGVKDGPASRSHGLQVARLAGLPAPVVRAAAQVLEALESQSRADDAQIDLFAEAAAPTDPAPGEPAADPALQAVAEALQALRPDELSPREALDLIYRWRATLAGG